MSEFKVDSEIIKESIETLKKLLDKCEEAYDKEIPKSDVDKGLVHSELDSLCENMKTTCQYLGELINNTIAFLNGSSEMFDTSDRESAMLLVEHVETQDSIKANSKPRSTMNSQNVRSHVDIGNYMDKVTDAEYAWLCKLSYDALKEKDPRKAFVNFIQNDSYLPDNDPLKKITSDQVFLIEDKVSGFSALTIGDGDNLIVIFAGTNGDAGDIIADAKLTLGGSTIQSTAAIKMVDTLSQRYSNIVVTGHSLGGYLATSATLKNSSISKCVTFDAPGRYDAGMQKLFNSDRTDVITSYEARGSLISSVGYDVGEVHRIAVKESGGAVSHNHSIENLCDALNKGDKIDNSWK